MNYITEIILVQINSHRRHAKHHIHAASQLPTSCEGQILNPLEVAQVSDREVDLAPYITQFQPRLNSIPCNCNGSQNGNDVILPYAHHWSVQGWLGFHIYSFPCKYVLRNNKWNLFHSKIYLTVDGAHRSGSRELRTGSGPGIQPKARGHMRVISRGGSICVNSGHALA